MATKFSQFINGGTISVGSQVAGLDAGVSPDNRIFNFPGLGILDTNGSVLLSWSQPPTGTAVNYLGFENALTGNPVVISSNGADANVGLYLTTEGSGAISLAPGTGGLVIIGGTTALGMPVGTTAQRPAASPGLTRYNSDSGDLEYYDGSTLAWSALSAASSSVTSVTGTANRVTSTGGTTPQIDISAAYIGQASITTLGTITAGTWDASIIGVTYGGTGSSSFNAYSVVCGGATGSSPLQSIGGLGTLGQVLTSQGPGALPVWTSGAGSVTNVSGTLNEITVINPTSTPVISISATYAGQVSINTLGTISTGIWNATPVTVSYGGTGNTVLTNYAVLCGGGSAPVQTVGSLGTAGQVLTSQGGAALPIWTSVGAGSVTSVSGTAGQIDSTGGATPVISIDPTYVGQTSITTLGTITTGTWDAGVIAGQFGGTGVVNTGKTITLGGNLTTSGAYASTFTMVGATNVTFPTSGTLSTSTGTVTLVSGTLGQIDVASGATTPVISIDVSYLGQTSITTLGTITTGTWHGTGLTVPYGGTGEVSFTAYGLICGGATSTAALQSVTSLGTAGQVLTSVGAGALPVWSTPSTGSVISVSGTANRITSTGGTTPVIDISASYVGQTSITTVGSISTGTWNGTILSPAYGGTGVNNAASTLTLAGNLATSGAFASTFTMTGATNVTFPTSGTLLTTAVLTNYATLNTTNSFAFNEQYQMRLQDYSETVNALGGVSGAITLDLTTANVFTATATGNITLSIVNVPASGTAASVSLLATNFGAYTIIWPAGTVWSNGSTPTLSASGENTVVLYTVNAGATWYAAAVGLPVGTVTSVTGTANQINVATGTSTPVISIAPTYVGQTSITTLGTVTTGTWDATIVSPTYGGTGINNGSNTLTLAGNLATSGAYSSTFTMTGATNVTFPTSGTLSTTTGTVTSVATGPGLAGGPITSAGTISVIMNNLCTGRLTLTSGLPVTTSDVIAATTIYFTPCKGNFITLYVAGVWTLYSFNELNISVPAVANQCYDVFVYSNAGVPTLYLVSWTIVVVRATPIVLQNGIYVLSGSPQYRYVGTIGTIAAGQTEDSVANRFVWNYYNRVERSMQVLLSTSWTYALPTIRQGNASTTNQLNMVIGIQEDVVVANLLVGIFTGAATIQIWAGIGLDSTTAVATNATGSVMFELTASEYIFIPAQYQGFVGVGKHSLMWLEASVNSKSYTVGGPGYNSFMQSGMSGVVFA